MSDILQFLTVQAMSGGLRLAPAMLAYASNGGQDPQNIVNDIPTGFENTAENLGWRAYDRAIRIRNEVDGVAYYAWQRDTVWELFNGSDFQLAIELADQITTLDEGIHTGLYHVTDGRTFDYVCGLYALTGGGTGWVKLDLKTKTWTRGAFPLASSFGTTMGKCVQHRGKLYHCAANALQEFDPVTDTILEYAAIGQAGVYAKLAVVQNRLFVFPDTGNPRVNELAFGSVNTLEVIDPGNTLQSSYAGGGDSLAVAGLDGNGVIGYFWCAGSAGFRFHRITVGAGSKPGDSVGITVHDIAIPDGGAASADFNGFTLNLRYPNADEPGLTGFMFTEGGYNLEDGPLYTTVPLQFVMFKLNLGLFATTAAAPASPRLDWNGAGAVMNFVHNDILHAGCSSIYSQNPAPWGDPTRLFLDGPTVGEIRTEPYSDGTIARGLRLTFIVSENGNNLANTGANLYFGFGRYEGRPDTRATLSTGDNPTTYPGGVAVFNPALNRLEDVPPSGADKTTLAHDAAVGVFIVGEIVEGQTSGARGLGAIYKASAMFVRDGTGFPFVDGEQLLGLTSGATANATAPPEANPTYQIIWDIDADGPIPDLEWVSLQGAQWEIEGGGRYRTGPAYLVHVLSEAFFVVPNTTQGDAAQINIPPTNATPQTTQGEPVQFDGQQSTATPFTTQSAAVQLDAPADTTTPTTTQSAAVQAQTPPDRTTPITTQSGAVQTDTVVDLQPNLLRKVPDRAELRGVGVVGIEDDAAPVADRAALDFEDSASLPSQGWVAKPLLPAGPLYSKRLDGKVLLGRVTIDAENDAALTRYTLLDVTAAGLGGIGVAPANLPLGSLLGAGLLLIVARAISVNGVISTQPEIRLGVGAPYNNQAAQQVVGLVADEQAAELAVVAARDVMLAGDVLEAELSVVAATTGSYVIEVLVYGFHRIG